MANNYGSLIGLTILSGSRAYLSALPSVGGTFESAAVRRAKAAFDIAPTIAPWKRPDKPSTVADGASSIRRMASIIDRARDPTAAGDPDVELSFTVYKALDRLKLLAQEAARPGVSSMVRTGLDTAFRKGMTDLEAYLAAAPANRLAIGLDTTGRSARSLGIVANPASVAMPGKAVAAARGAPIDGFSGTEVISIEVSRVGGTADRFTVALADLPQPPELDEIAAAFNAQLASVPMLDEQGNPMLDAKGVAILRWQSRFSVARAANGEWGLAYTVPAYERVTMSEAGAPAALMVVNGSTVMSSATVMSVRRFDDPATGLTPAAPAVTIAAVDRAASDQARLVQDSRPKMKTPPGVTLPKVDTTVRAAMDVRAVASTPDGFSYVVGTTAGDLGDGRSDGQNTLFLTKLDNGGQVVWQRLLDAPGSAEGAAVSIDQGGNVTVVGSAAGSGGGAPAGERDMMVARYSAAGDRIMSATIPAIGDDVATAVTTDADGAIYVGGRSATSGGVLIRLNAAGRIESRAAIAGASAVTALALDANGALLALTRGTAGATVQRIDRNAIDRPVASIALGQVDARAFAQSATGEIAVVGAQTTRPGGDSDGFVARIDAGLTTVATTRIATDAGDEVDSVVYAGDALYVGGRTAGALDGEPRGSVDGFVARLDGATGTVEQISQFGTGASRTEPVRVAVTIGGRALNLMGLHAGTLRLPPSEKLVAQTGLNVDDSFAIQLDSGRVQRFRITADDTLETLSRRIGLTLGRAAVTVTTPAVAGKRTLDIKVANGRSLRLIAGPKGSDALAKLGLEPQRLTAAASSSVSDSVVRPGGTFGLGLPDGLGIASRSGADLALKKLVNASATIQSAYRSLYWDDGKAAVVDGGGRGGGAGGKPNAYQQSQIAGYRAALARLMA